MSDYRVRVTAEVADAEKKLDAVQSQLKSLSQKPYDISIGVDANTLRRSVQDTATVASNVRAAATDLKDTASVRFINSNALSDASTLAATVVSLRRDLRGVNQDLAKSVSRTNVSEFMRTDQFLQRVLDNSRSKTRDIAEAYENIRQIPGAAEALGPVENYARAQVWNQFGNQIAEQTLQGVGQGLKQGAQATKNFLYKDLFNEIQTGTFQAIDTLGRLGLAIQGVQLLISPLAAAWSAAFDQVIGQNIRLEQTILATQTTLASTGRIINKTTGEEVTDPLQKIEALGADVRKAIDSIRVRSLDLAGVTSQQIIDIFGVVATSISQVNGSIKDAEDLSISFTAALGTLGVPFYQARQEIGSILGGYITEDSILAKRLQISNADIAKAKQSVDGVVGYLKKKLEVAVAGQAISAKGFAGVTSNIQESIETIAQRIGQPLLAPLVSGLTGIYSFLKKIQNVVAEVGNYISKIIVGALTKVVDIVSGTKLFQSVGKSIAALAEPYERLAQAVQLGISKGGVSLIEQWVNGLEKVPPAFQGIVGALISIGNFIKLQIDLIKEPLTQLIDQTREMSTDGAGIAKGIARVTSIPFGNFIELTDTFTKGWDTLTSTIQETVRVIGKVGIALVKLKITEFTAQLRAAAKVFEVFGSVVLGRINLAVAVFDYLATILSSDFAQFLVSLVAINKLINSTDFFGIKGITMWAVATRKVFQQLIDDTKLFVKGFKDAGNINTLLQNVQTTAAGVFKAQSKSPDSVLRNSAVIESLTVKLKQLQEAQKQAVEVGKNISTIDNYGKSIKRLEENLAKAKQTQEQFTASQRATAVLKSVFSGSTELAQAKESARQAQVMASGAATAQALSGAMEVLAKRLGLTKEEMKTLGGATRAAGTALRQFLTTSMLINIGFTAAGLLIAAGISAWQKYEEGVKSARMEALRMGQVQKILNSGWSGVTAAAEGGDIAAQKKISEAQEQANAAMQIQQEKRNKLVEEESVINDKLYNNKRKLAEAEARGNKEADSYLYYARAVNTNQEQLVQNKKKQEVIDKKIYEIQRAQQLVTQEKKLSDDFTVLAERRKDLEEKIKATREEYEKELGDKAFQKRMEVLSIEQQKRQEMQQQELKALQERYRVLNNSSPEGEKKFIAIAQEYKTAMLEAANAEQNARSEFIQKEAQLRKEIDDYAYKMQKERVNLEKVTGNYVRQLEQYKNDQQKARIQKELNFLRQSQKLKGTFFQPYNLEQQQGFINAAQGEGLNTNQAYAMLQLIPKNALGLSGTEDIRTVMALLKAELSNRKKVGRADTLEGIIKEFYPGVNPGDLASKLLRESQGALNNSQWYKTQDSKNVATPNLNIDYAGMNARVKGFADSVLNATRELDRLRSLGDMRNVKMTLSKYEDPSLYTDIKNSYTTELMSAVNDFNEAGKALANLTQEAKTLDSELERIKLVQLQGYRGALNTETTGLNQQEIDKALKLIQNRDWIKVYDMIIRANKGNFDKARDFQEMATAIAAGADNARAQVRTNLPAAKQVDDVRQGTAIVAGMEQMARERATGGAQEAITRFTEAVRAGTSETYSLSRAQEDVRLQVQQYLLSELGKVKGSLDPNIMDGIAAKAKQLETTLTDQVKAYDGFYVALTEYSRRLALSSQFTEAYISAYRTMLSEIMSGGSLTEAFNKFFESISSEVMQTFINAATEPIKEQMLQMTRNLFGVTSAEEKARLELIRANSTLEGSITSLDSTVNRAISTIERMATRKDASQASVGTYFNEKVSKDTPFTSYNKLHSTKLPTTLPAFDSSSLDALNSESMAFAFSYNSQLAEITKTAEAVKTQSETTSKQFGRMQTVLGGIVQGFASIAMGMAGIEQMGKGGTYNTLMGIAGIFGMIGGVTGMFGTGGIFGPKPKPKALGGPVTARQPYLVGERGPELFVPKGSGQIIPNDRTQALLASRAALGQANGTTSAGAFDANREALAANATLTRERLTERAMAATLSAPAQPLNIKYETQVINNVEYVSADQFQRGLSDAAERGRALTLSALKNSVKTRRQVGI